VSIPVLVPTFVLVLVLVLASVPAFVLVSMSMSLSLLASKIALFCAFAVSRGMCSSFPLRMMQVDVAFEPFGVSFHNFKQGKQFGIYCRGKSVCLAEEQY